MCFVNLPTIRNNSKNKSLEKAINSENGQLGGVLLLPLSGGSSQVTWLLSGALRGGQKAPAGWKTLYCFNGFLIREGTISAGPTYINETESSARSRIASLDTFKGAAHPGTKNAFWEKATGAIHSHLCKRSSPPPRRSPRNWDIWRLLNWVRKKGALLRAVHLILIGVHSTAHSNLGREDMHKGKSEEFTLLTYLGI